MKGKMVETGGIRGIPRHFVRSGAGHRAASFDAGRSALQTRERGLEKALQASRNASAGRRRAAWNAGHAVANRHTPTAKAPVRRNSAARI